mmetsp:Transcript_99141/g.280087  ORF Transcript_99141/g.280087 Transcript_99141/m.280087 type:complete len:294 (-) Transcript_99141:2528-3409(-)
MDPHEFLLLLLLQTPGELLEPRLPELQDELADARRRRLVSHVGLVHVDEDRQDLREVCPALADDLPLLALRQPHKSSMVLHTLLLVLLAWQPLQPQTPELRLVGGHSLRVVRQDLKQSGQCIVGAGLRRFLGFFLGPGARLCNDLSELGGGLGCHGSERGVLGRQRGSIARRLTDFGQRVHDALQQLRQKLRPQTRYSLLQVLEQVARNVKCQLAMVRGRALEQLLHQPQRFLEELGRKGVRVVPHENATHLATRDPQGGLLLRVVLGRNIVVVVGGTLLLRLGLLLAFEGLA